MPWRPCRRVLAATDLEYERLTDGACPLFGAVLGPDFNAAHRDHLHLDRSRFGICR